MGNIMTTWATLWDTLDTLRHYDHMGNIMRHMDNIMRHVGNIMRHTMTTWTTL